MRMQGYRGGGWKSDSALCHAEGVMPGSALILGIDTCGPSGSVALGRVVGGSIEILGQIELEGGSYSATLVAAVGELLTRYGVELRGLAAIVAVSGPGSFTGVRVGLSAVKGLAEAASLPVVSVSRLEVLAAEAGAASAAIDAHRHEVYLRVGEPGGDATELLAGASGLAEIEPPPARVAVCDEAASALLSASWPASEQVRHAPPTAADALKLAAPRVAAREFVDVALLDAHYLRRSDAEIFGEPIPAQPDRR